MSSREGSPVKLIYAAIFALFPLSAPAQTPDALLLSALCSDDYYEDTGQCRAGEVLNILDLLEKYNAVVNRDANHDELVGVLPSDIPEDMRVGSIIPPIEADPAILLLPDDDLGDDEKPVDVRDTISYQVTAPQPHIAEVVEAVDDVATTGPAAMLMPTDDDAVSE
jgi:hypothetical protein